MIQTNRLIAAGVLLLGGVVLALVFLPWRGCGDQRDTLRTREIVDNNITNSKIDAWGRQIVESNANYVTRDELRNSQNAVVAGVRDQLVGPIRNLEQATRVIATKMERIELGVRDTTIQINGRTIEAKAFSFANQWVNIAGYCSIDSVWLDYTMKADYRLEYRWVRPKGLFSAKELEVTVVSNDPQVRIDKVQTLSLRTPTPWYGKPVPAAAMGFAGGLIVGLIIPQR